MFRQRMEWYLQTNPDLTDVVRHLQAPGQDDGRLLALVSPDRLRRILATMLDEAEFLSPFGVRSLSKFHERSPLVLDLGDQRSVLDYEPAESRSGLFGGNSNWRGPIWFPINYLLIESVRRFDRYLDDSFTVECPTGSGRQLNLTEVADELSRRLLSLFLDRGDEGRPVSGGRSIFQSDPAWQGPLFYEYFHGDTGAGLGASHQTGWTGLVAHLALQVQPALAHSSPSPLRGGWGRGSW
jgi:hypothetical protein